METQCDQCRFWEAESETHGEFGYCHRYPPTVKFVTNVISGETVDVPAVFPEVSADDWCGEFQPKPEVK